MKRTSAGKPSTPVAVPIKSGRLITVFLGLLILAGVTVFRLVSIQLLQHSYYVERAEKQYTDTIEIGRAHV